MKVIPAQTLKRQTDLVGIQMFRAIVASMDDLPWLATYGSRPGAALRKSSRLASSRRPIQDRAQASNSAPRDAMHRFGDAASATPILVRRSYAFGGDQKRYSHTRFFHRPLDEEANQAFN